MYVTKITKIMLTNVINVDSVNFVNFSIKFHTRIYIYIKDIFYMYCVRKLLIHFLYIDGEEHDVFVNGKC